MVTVEALLALLPLPLLALLALLDAALYLAWWTWFPARPISPRAFLSFGLALLAVGAFYLFLLIGNGRLMADFFPLAQLSSRAAFFLVLVSMLIAALDAIGADLWSKFRGPG